MYILMMLSQHFV